MILLDYSQIAIANIFHFQDDLKKGMTDKESAQNIIRHAILSGILYYKNKFSNDYGNMIIACDSKNYWRKDYFPNYKAGRKKTRDKSDLDWKLIFEIISQIREEIKENFPYKVIHVDKVEADDIIAVLSKYTQMDNSDHPLFVQTEPVLIISSDGDFKQLHKYDNIRQWSPIQNKYVTCKDPLEYLNEHIMKGDAGDGIPSILSKDDAFIDENYRQPPLTKKRKEAILSGELTEEMKRNWDRNKQLIDFDMIPNDVINKIVDQYINYSVVNDKMKIYDYFVKNGCRLLLDRIEEF